MCYYGMVEKWMMSSAQYNVSIVMVQMLYSEITCINQFS